MPGINSTFDESGFSDFLESNTVQRKGLNLPYLKGMFEQFAAETEAVRIVTNNLFTTNSPRNFVGLTYRGDIVSCAYNVREYGARIRRNGGLVYVY